jgi:hypothetical protein
MHQNVHHQNGKIQSQLSCYPVATADATQRVAVLGSPPFDGQWASRPHNRVTGRSDGDTFGVAYCDGETHVGARAGTDLYSLPRQRDAPVSRQTMTKTARSPITSRSAQGINRVLPPRASGVSDRAPRGGSDDGKPLARSHFVQHLSSASLGHVQHHFNI